VSAPTPLARLKGVHKRFGDVHAVAGVDLDLWPGEIHGILGENGAGKTTLMCLLAGLYPPDQGTLEMDGRPARFGSPRDAMAAGVGMVHQHFTLVPSLTVWENLLLGARHIPALLWPARQVARAAEAARSLGLPVDPRARVADLSLGEQQRVEVLRVLHRGARVMILDEPTAVLSPGEAEALFRSLRRLCRQGTAVVIISHKLEEVRAVAHRITVMRRGRVVARHDDPAGQSAEALASQMVGREVTLTVDRPEGVPGPPLLSVTGLEVSSDRRLPAVRGLDLEVLEGEILGLAGVAGHGQGELLEALAGLREASAGEARLDGHDLLGRSVRERMGLGLRLVPADRNRTGTAPSLSVRENLLLRDYHLPPCRRGPWLDLTASDDWASDRVARLKVDTTGLDQQTRLLSGGNVQKVVLARELRPDARMILCMHPTRGLDAWAQREVWRQLLEARGRRAGVLLCSEDLDEVLALSDRVAVMCEGRITGLFTRDEADRVQIGKLMTRGGKR